MDSCLEHASSLCPVAVLPNTCWSQSSTSFLYDTSAQYQGAALKAMGKRGNCLTFQACHHGLTPNCASETALLGVTLKAFKPHCVELAKV
eukprot:5307298-Amphidinium_carterae.1